MRHVAREEPTVRENLVGGLFVLVVAFHHAGAFHRKLSDLSLGNGLLLVIHNADLPAVACFSDGAYLVNIFNAEMYTAGTDGLAESVVGVVIVLGEYGLPTLDQTGRHGLRADVHETPGREIIVREVDVPAVDAVQNILCPRHQEPNDGASLLGGGAHDQLRCGAFQQYRAGASHQAAEPVHFRARVIERRNAEKYVVLGLTVMLLLHGGGVGKTAMIVQNGFGEACGSAGKIDRRVVLFGERNVGIQCRLICRQLLVALGKVGAIVSYVDPHSDVGVSFYVGFHAPDKFRSEHQMLGIRFFETVGNLVGGVAIVQRNGNGTRFEDTEVNGKPLQAVHEQDRYLGAFHNPSGKQKIGEAVGFFVKFLPGHLASSTDSGGLRQSKFAPGFSAFSVGTGVDLHQRHAVGRIRGVSFQ